MYNVALIFAGGVGSRMGEEVPKQFLEWDGKTILIHTLDVFELSNDIDEIVVACKEDWIDFTNGLINEAKLKKVASIVPGGKSALESQYNGLKEIERMHAEKDVAVFIHDGVRPFLDQETISSCAESVKEHGNAITVTKAIETVINIDDSEQVVDILDRDFCRMAKAPQCFKLNEIIEAHELAIKEDIHNFIDSASLMMHYGHKLNTVIGEPENIKITTPSDYYMFLGIASRRDTLAK